MSSRSTWSTTLRAVVAGQLRPDPASPTYDPIPILTAHDADRQLADGCLQLVRGHDHHRAVVQRPAGACRLWYVVFITDGEESCGLNACDPDQAAWKFKLPDLGQPVKVFMIGFSEEFDPMNPSPLQCVSEITDGQFFAAANAASSATRSTRSSTGWRGRPLVRPLQGVAAAVERRRLEPGQRLPGAVPLFVPQQDESIWTGNLYAFALKHQTRPCR